MPLFEGGADEWKAANKSSKALNDEGMSRKDLSEVNQAVHNVKEVIDSHKAVSEYA